MSQIGQTATDIYKSAPLSQAEALKSGSLSLSTIIGKLDIVKKWPSESQPE